MRKILLLSILLSCTALLVGCGGDSGDFPTKPGGGGLPQPYSPDTGKYIPD